MASSGDRTSGPSDQNASTKMNENTSLSSDNRKEPNMNPPSVQRTFSGAREYAQALRPWLWQYQNCQVLQSFAANFTMQMNMMSHLNTLNNNYCSSFTPPSHIGTRFDPYANRRPPIFQQTGQNQQQNTTNTSGGPEQLQGQQGQQGELYRVPTFWKRVAAELIDFSCLFYIKMMVSMCLMSEFSLDHISFINSEDLLESFSDLDYDTAFAITFEVIALEIINRILITIFETLCLYRTVAGGVAIGATPGKRLMGLRVVSCDTVQPVGRNGQVMVSPAGHIPLKNAFLRSVIKNFTIAFFFPACLTLFFFKHNRTAYDVLAHTIVVEDVA